MFHLTFLKVFHRPKLSNFFVSARIRRGGHAKNRLILANRLRVPELNPFFCESRFGGLEIANRASEG